MNKKITIIVLAILLMLSAISCMNEDVEMAQATPETCETEVENCTKTDFDKFYVPKEDQELMKEIMEQIRKDHPLPPVTADKSKGTNPSPTEIYDIMKEVAVDYNVPAEILYGVACEESNLRQYTSSGAVLISGDNGIGIMQVTPWAIDEDFDEYSLKYNIRYNIEAGAQVILGKWYYVTGRNPIGDNNPDILENWYFALWAYNGYSTVNNPNHYVNGPKQWCNSRICWWRYDAYQNDVLENIETELGINITPISRWNLPSTGIPSSGASFSTPTPVHYTATASKNLKTIELVDAGNFNVKGIIENESAETISNFKVTLWINGTTTQKTVSSIAPESTMEILFTPADTNLSTQNLYGYALLVDSTAIVQEVNEDDNKVTDQLAVLDPNSNLPADVIGNWAVHEIEFMIDNGFMSGYTDGTFRPDNELTRAEFATMIVNTLNPQVKTEYANRTFTDISGHWAYDNILLAARSGYMGGYPDGTFRPNEKLTKLVSIVALANGAEMTGGNIAELSAYFNDSDNIADWAEQSVSNALTNGMVVNYPYTNLFEPTKNITRAETVAVIYQTMVQKGTASAYNNEYLVVPGDVPETLTLDMPNTVTVGETITISGTATGDITKVEISRDNQWVIDYATVQSDGTYSLSYAFNTAGSGQIYAIGLDSQLNEILTVTAPITIEEDTATTDTFGSDFADYADANWQALLNEANNNISGGTACVAFVSAALRAFGYDIWATVTDGTSTEEATGMCLKHELEQNGFVQGSNPEYLMKGDILFTIDKWFDDDQGGNYYPTHAYIFIEWETPGSTEYAYVVDNQGDRHVRNITASGPKDPYQFHMRKNTDGNNNNNNNSLPYIENVPYFYQYNNSNNPGGSCQNTAMAMVLKYYGATSETPDDISNYYGTSQAQTVSGWQSVFNSEAQYFGLNVRDAGTTTGSITKVRQLLDEGKPVVVHGYFTTYGHVITLVGFDGTYYYANDPAGKWNEVYQGGGYSGYNSTEGNYVKYHKDALEYAIAPDGNVWMHEIYFTD